MTLSKLNSIQGVCIDPPADLLVPPAIVYTHSLTFMRFHGLDTLQFTKGKGKKLSRLVFYWVFQKEFLRLCALGVLVHSTNRLSADP